MPRLVALVVFLLLALPVRANIGDTVADCIKRYGKPATFTEANAKTPFGTLAFVAGPYEMVIFLYHNVEVGARVDKRDKTAFSPDEIKTILNADAPTPWVPAPRDDPNYPQWARSDKASVTYDTDKKMLVFTTPDMAQALRAPPPEVPAASAPAAPPRPPGNFVPATPTPWAPPQPPSTNADPATNFAPATNAPAP